MTCRPQRLTVNQPFPAFMAPMNARRRDGADEMAGPLIPRGATRLAGWRRQLTSLSGGLIAAVVAACIMVGGLEAWHAWASRATTIASDKIETANLARSLAQHVHDLVQAADVVLIHTRE